jgi:hypothetical protein
MFMLDAKSASELYEVSPVKITEACDRALDKAVIKAIES